MKITFIYHSGFAIESESCIVIFDYWMDPTNAMENILKSKKPIYVFASHFHEDHFTKDIFEWRTQHGNITYLLSKDILKHRRAEKDDADAWFGKGATWEDKNIIVTATGSNDSGVSWIVEVDGLRIFHAGDLGNWYARFLTDDYRGGEIYSEEFGELVNPEKEEKRYLGELKSIAKVATNFDVAFLPVDGRIGNGYTRGARQFIDKFNVRLLVPMHFTASGFQSAWRMEEFTKVKDVDFWKIGKEGATFKTKDWPRRMRIDPNFVEPEERDGDEFWPNGVFIFNITRVLEDIESGKLKVERELIDVVDWHHSHFGGVIHEDYMPQVKLGKPIIQAEIRANAYEIIDGHHRFEKALREDVPTIDSYKLSGHQIARYITSKESYETYVRYWNGKIEDYFKWL